mmetsp:Transcript_14513/g.24084  ORF Transcript_14513/g.24084 Transcript_14513/m.24084 type:complete len:123 (+) Transcript_14513:1069-1437(+)
MSTTVTFSARFATLKYFFSLGMVPHPKDDYFASLAIAKSGATILCPIPSLSTHIEFYGNDLKDGSDSSYINKEEYISLYHDWFEEGKRFVQSAKEMEWNLWSLTDHYSATAPATDKTTATVP